MRLENDRRHFWLRACCLAIAVGFSLSIGASRGPAQLNQPGNDQERQGPVPIESSEIEAIMNEQPAVTPTDPSIPSGIDLLTLFASGGAFMIPIAVMSFLVVALSVERLLTLRKRKVIPKSLIDQLRQLTDPLDRFNPSDAYDLCVDQPSSTARVIKAMLMRTGQSMADVERTATETIDREADRLAAPIRWLTLAAAATPLMGLLGTVWGMIVAFHESTTLTADRSRSEQLSEGIYTALVTTLAGLIVAIPAAILALYLENRLAKLFHSLEQVVFDVAPAIGQFSGRKRLDSHGKLHSIAAPLPPPIDQIATPPPPPTTSSAGTGQSKLKNHGTTKRVS